MVVVYNVTSANGQWELRKGFLIEVDGQEVILYQAKIAPVTSKQWCTTVLLKEWCDTPSAALAPHLEQMKARHLTELSELTKLETQ